MVLSTALLLVLAAAAVYIFFKRDPEPILKYYYQPGKWYRLKYQLFYFLVNLRKRKSATKATGDNAGLGMKSRGSIEEMDKVQKLPPEHPLAVDAVYFNGANNEECWFVAATARRHNNLVQTLLYIRLKDIGLLELPSLPDTSLEGTAENSYAAGGLVIEPVEPMKRWKIKFNGPMRLIKSDGSKETVKVDFDLDWLAYTRYFDFDTDLPTTVLCDAVARQPWSREMFDKLRRAHQTHYEQFGEISGKINIENHPPQDIKLQGVRDHSYGNVRDWRDIHRYAIQYLHLKDGKAICIGMLCLPDTMSRLIIGYVMYKDGNMDPVDSCDTELHLLGEDGNDPTKFRISFTAGDKQYNLQGTVIDRPVFYMGRNWESRIVERMCTYVVNGTPGWGISEWCYSTNSVLQYDIKLLPSGTDDTKLLLASGRASGILA